MPTELEKFVVIEKITDRIENRYEAVRVMAKEARRLNSLVIRGADVDADFKPTTTGMDRLIEGRIEYRFVEEVDENEGLFEEE